MTRVFVYGTLKRGCENHRWIDSQRFVGVSKTKPVYRLYDLGGYPGMVKAKNGVAVEGELWDVNPASLSRLDVLEDVVGGEYERAPIELESGQAEGYLYLRSIDGCRDCGTSW